MKYYVLVRFIDKRNVAVVTSDSIKGFNPKHSEDFSKEQVYQVSWQDGEGSFDGFFSANIICQAVSLEDLRLKALAGGVKRMPTSYHALLASGRNDSDHGSDSSVGGKRVGKPPIKFTPRDKQVTKKVIKPTTQIKRKKGSAPLRAARKKRMTDTLNLLRNNLPCKTIENSSEKQLKKKTVAEKKNNSESILINEEDNLQSPHQVKPFAASSPSSSDRSDGFSVEALDNVEADQSDDENSYGKLTSDEGCYSQTDVFSGAEYNNKELESNDSTSKLMDYISHLKKELDEKDKALEALRAELDKQQGEIGELEKTIGKLKTAVKVSELARKNGLAEIEKMKTHQSSDTRLRQEIAKLKGRISSAASLLLSGSQKLSPPADFHVLPAKRLDFSTPQKPVEMTPESYSTSADIVQPTCSSVASFTPSPSSSAVSSTKKDSGKKSKAHLKSILSDGGGEVLSKEEMQEITTKVLRDLSGEEKLHSSTDGMVDLGHGIVLTEEQWIKGVKKQEKPSLFVKKLGHAIYGHDGLKSRTVGNPVKTSNKHSATPTKVDAIVACYRAKLLHNCPNITNLNALSLQARDILAAKMQDEARVREKKTVVGHQSMSQNHSKSLPEEIDKQQSGQDLLEDVLGEEF